MKEYTGGIQKLQHFINVKFKKKGITDGKCDKCI